MSRGFNFTVIIFLLWFCPVAQAAEIAVLSFTEKPVAIVRGAELYRAVAGASLESGDLIETDGNSIQIEGLGAGVVSLGPHTRIYLEPHRDGKATLIGLLNGWLKIQARPAPSYLGTIIATPKLNFAFVDGAVILHVQNSREEIFDEEGVHTFDELDSRRKVARSFKIGRDQFAVLKNELPLEFARRPSHEFIRALPAAFRDAAMPVAARIKARMPLEKERDVAFEDVEAWLRTDLGMEKLLLVRFRPRLKDPGFRKALDAQLGQTPAWKPVLHPPRLNRSSGAPG